MAIGLVMSYYAVFKAYHQALERHTLLTQLLYNPNARVASGEIAK